ncbi:P-loop containing nucleoside triphosphate hydrolase protein [Marasmius fiardii PR-910]|nr:P-loop containing nucleoside triphosphate hydrolase protein [Marasmius fiardii PR-910]
MKTFAATAIQEFRVCSQWLRFSYFRRMSRTAEALADKKVSRRAHVQPTFEALGLNSHLVKAVRAAFPKVEFPTATQAQLITAINKKRDVILQDGTGSGKTFGLVLASLNKPRVKYSDYDVPSITTIFLVPHRDLALQIRHWIQKITESSSDTPPPLSQVVQVLLRDGQMHLQSGMEQLSKTPPHVLIATPTSFLEVLQKHDDIIDFSRVSAVVVDEVDDLIETIPDTKTSLVGKIRKRIARHPGPTRQILDIIYNRRKRFTAKNREEFVDEPYQTPQLILSSATIRRHLKEYFFGESGIIKGNVVKVRGTILPLHVKEMLATSALHTDISHHVLVVSDNNIENLPGAVEVSDEEEESTLTPRLSAGEEPVTAPVKTEVELVRELGFSMTPSPFNQNSLEAVAAAFALYVPSIALLVIPGDSSIYRAVYDLRALGVNAHNVDMLAEHKGRLHLLSGNSASFKATPTLLVASVAAMRGLDLPELQHVFILGTLGLEGTDVTSRTLDTYIHTAGRVGRFGKKGMVVSVIDGEQDDQREVKRMDKILKRLGILPVKLKQFP